MAIVSYRLYCQKEDCSTEKVIPEERIDDSLWKIITLHYHEGICPACNPSVDVSDADEACPPFKDDDVPFAELDAIGESGAENLREKGIVTRQDVADSSDEEILETSWVGEKGLASIRQEVQE